MNDEKLAKSSRTSIFRLPIYNAIALEDKSGNSVSIFFCQRSPSLFDGFAFEVAQYDAKSFLTPEELLLARSVMPSHALLLKDGRIFEAELRVEEISEHMVAQLAVAFSEPVNRQLQQFAGKHRSPLNMMTKHRGSPNRGSILEVDDRKE